MSEQRQKIQLELALPGAREGEARTALRRFGDYAVAFATAAVRSHLHTRRGRMSIECCDQPEIAQAFLES